MFNYKPEAIIFNLSGNRTEEEAYNFVVIDFELWSAKWICQRKLSAIEQQTTNDWYVKNFCALLGSHQFHRHLHCFI